MDTENIMKRTNPQPHVVPCWSPPHLNLALRCLPRLLAASLVCIVASGCAFTRTETKISFSPSVSLPLKAERKAALEVAEVKDSRPVKDKSVVIHKQNAYGTTTGAYVSRTPVSEILRNGLIEAFKFNGFVGNTASNYELRVDLQEFGFDSIAGFWTATVKSKLVARFELVEKSSGDPKWHDTLIGRHTGKTAWGTKEFLADMFSKTADDLVKQLVEDKTFRSFFE